MGELTSGAAAHPLFQLLGKRGKGQVEKQVGGTADIWAPE